MKTMQYRNEVACGTKYGYREFSVNWHHADTINVCTL